MAHDSATGRRSIDTEIEVTSEMIVAGVEVLRENYLTLDQGEKFPEIVRTLLERSLAKLAEHRA
jgi:hypothetical protein